MRKFIAILVLLLAVAQIEARHLKDYALTEDDERTGHLNSMINDPHADPENLKGYSYSYSFYGYYSGHKTLAG